MSYDTIFCKNPKCKKSFIPKREWQKFCEPKCQKEYWRDVCNDKYWKKVYKEKASVNKRLEKIEEQLNIK